MQKSMDERIDAIEETKAMTSKHTSFTIMLCCLLGVTYFVLSSNNPFSSSSTKDERQIITTPSRYKQPTNGIIVNIVSGCSGSSAADSFLIDILQQHAIPVPHGNHDVMKERNNPFYEDAKAESDGTKNTGDRYEIIMNALKVMHQDYIGRDEVMMVKVNTQNNLTPHVIKAFQQMNASFTHMYRSNVLDFHICMTKDCFYGPKHGYSVYENGTKDELCFERRRYPNVKLKVHLNPSTIISKMSEKIVTESRAEYIARSLNSYSTATEDLFEYEYSDDEGAFQKSLKAWSTVIEPLVDVVNEGIIKENMRLNQNTRRPRAKHVKEIDNFKAVYYTLRNNEDPLHKFPLDYFVRL